jgi:hypothetical protein
MIYKKCPKCKGRGWIVDKTLSLFTLGLSFAIQSFMNLDEIHPNDKCDFCNGFGYIDFNIKKEEVNEY